MATTPGVPLTGLTDTADLRNGTVLVPDADADGEALAYDQAGWRLGVGSTTGILTTPQLNLEGNAPIVQINETDQPVDARSWRISTFNGTLYVTSISDVGVTQKTPIRIDRDGTIRFASNGDGAVRMDTATSVSVPAATVAGHAAQVSAIDATTGRLAIGGQEIGDTGDLDIKAVLLNSWTSSDGGTAPVVLRRNGNVCTLGGRVDGSASTATTLYTLPTGFRAGFNNPATGVCVVGGTILSSVYLNSTTTILLSSTANGQRFSITWMTDDAWPTSLPGSPAAAEQLPA